MFGSCKAAGALARIRLNGVMSDSRGLVVVVEDESAIADIERIYLVDAGFTVHVSGDGETGLDAIRRLRPVAAIVDIGLPAMDGIELCRTLRDADDWTPIVFVTARDSEVDRILGLELGADDYVTKPFSARELASRVKGLVRRNALGGRSTMLELGELLSAVWGVADYRGSRTVDVHVAQLRSKLGDAFVLRTIRGVGYALDVPSTGR
jgi:DNA-binding response OmpR family regulator